MSTTVSLVRVGECRNCGACCYITFPDGKRRICPHYDATKDKHCRIYVDRPKACRDFPRGPMDLERVAKWCGFKFVDARGRVVDGYMDKRVRLVARR